MCLELGRQVRSTDLRERRMNIGYNESHWQRWSHPERTSRVGRRENETQNFGGNIPSGSKDKKSSERLRKIIKEGRGRTD